MTLLIPGREPRGHLQTYLKTKESEWRWIMLQKNNKSQERSQKSLEKPYQEPPKLEKAPGPITLNIGETVFNTSLSETSRDQPGETRE